MADTPASISHVAGFDDAPFPRSHRGDVLVAGAVFAGPRLDGVLSTRGRRDGSNSTDRLVACLTASILPAKPVWKINDNLNQNGFPGEKAKEAMRMRMTQRPPGKTN